MPLKKGHSKETVSENISEWQRTEVKLRSTKWQRVAQSLDTGPSLSNLSDLEIAERKVTGFPATDLGNAERFVQWHGENVKYCVLEKSWYIWNISSSV